MIFQRTHESDTGCRITNLQATMESNPSSALEEILETPDRLKDLDLDAFAEELERQGYGNKRITLYDIRDELFGQYRERRLPYRALTVEERFRLLTGETSETLYVGKMVVCGVTGFANRKPPRDMIDQAQPVRNEETGQWQCPFCLQDTFPDLSEVRVAGDQYKVLDTCHVHYNGVRRFMPLYVGVINCRMLSPQA